MSDDDDYRVTPPAVVAAVAIGTAPLPFLAVYATLFILHGSVHPIHPPDITSSQRGELYAGLIALALFIVTTISLVWFLNARRRWPFAVMQLGVLGAAIDFLIDSTKGGTYISLLLVATTVVAVLLGFAPDGWRHVGRSAPPLVTRAYRVIGLGSVQASDETAPDTSAHPRQIPGQGDSTTYPVLR